MTDGVRGRSTRRKTITAVFCSIVGSLAGCLEGSDDNDGAASFDAPEEVLRDEQFSLAIEGVPAEETIEIIVETTDEFEQSWRARTVVDTGSGEGSESEDETGDEHGNEERTLTLDLDDADPIDGDVPAELEVPTTMALLQFLSPDNDVQGYQPMERTELRFGALVDDTLIGSTRVDWVLSDPDVEETRLETDDLIGWLYEPTGDEPTPAAMTLHGSDGEPNTGTAAQLASNGFTALALEYFAEADPLPRVLADVPLSYFERAIEWLLERDRVEDDRVGLIGVSKGGECALLAGSHIDEVGAVVSINGSGVVWPGFHEGSSSWMVDGDPVPYVPAVEHDAWGSRTLEPAYAASFEAADEETLEEATIPVEEIRAPVCLVSGGKDNVWPS